MPRDVAQARLLLYRVMDRLTEAWHELGELEAVLNGKSSSGSDGHPVVPEGVPGQERPHGSEAVGQGKSLADLEARLERGLREELDEAFPPTQESPAPTGEEGFNRATAAALKAIQKRRSGSSRRPRRKGRRRG